MELRKIEIQDYKSIKEPVTIHFQKGKPTILIGKNGSGKTNVLDALSVIASANHQYYDRQGKEPPVYRAYIQLSEEDMTSLFPDVVYDKSKCEMIAYSSGDGLKIDRIRSEYLVPCLKKELADIRALALQLEEAIDMYEKQLLKVSHDGCEELPIHAYCLKKTNGGLTNYNALHWRAECFIEDVRKVIDSMQQTYDDDEIALTFIAQTPLSFGRIEERSFQLEYVEPSLAPFEQKFVSIDRTAIKREIAKINKATKDACERIDQLTQEIEDRTNRIQTAMDVDRRWHLEHDERYCAFLHQVQHIIGQQCSFLKSEMRDVLFGKENGNYEYNEPSNSIMHTYLSQVYSGTDREELLSASRRELHLSEQAIQEFECFLNQHIPAFDREMYERISIRTSEKGNVSIFLHEKTGKEINLNETSAGRRWYFTYYFKKNMLNTGDLFIIDEPAALLHPCAQREILNDLAELAKQGIRVVYSTHCPHLIPKDGQGVHFVTMAENGTKITRMESYKDMLSLMPEVGWDDAFAVQIFVDKYVRGDPVKIGRNCYNAIRKKNTDLDYAAEKLFISSDTIKSWNRKGTHFRCPKIETVIAVAKYADLDLENLLN